jgi:hypothetical protein
MRAGGYPALLFSLHRIHENKQNRPDSGIMKKIPVLVTKFFVWRCEAGLKNSWISLWNFLYAVGRPAKKNYRLSSRNFLYAVSSPIPYSTVFFVGT